MAKTYCLNDSVRDKEMNYSKAPGHGKRLKNINFILECSGI